MNLSTPPSDGLLQVGDHCNFCNDLDFLPFTCDDCGNVFCQQHRKPDSHSCSQKLKKQQQQQPKQPPKPAAMTAVAPTKYTRPATASTNGRRLGSSPAGTPPPANIKSTQATEKSNNNKAALEKLKSLWGSNKSSNTTPSSSSQTSSSGSNLFSGWKKPSLAAQLRTSRAQELKLLNQLKRDAKGDAKIELSHRRYLYFESAATGKKVPVYHRDDIITGKLLDKAAEALNINLRTANSSATGGGKMALYLARTQQFLPYNEKLSIALGGAVKDGDTLILKLKPDSG